MCEYCDEEENDNGEPPWWAGVAWIVGAATLIAGVGVIISVVINQCRFP